MTTIPKEYLLELIEAAIQAPSADNCQPWKFKLLDDGFELWLDTSNMGLFFDVKGVATLMSCGALIENVVILAKALGWATQTRYFFNDSTDVLQATGEFARFTFTSNGKQPDTYETRENIYSRHSDRNLFIFNKKKIADNVLVELTDLVQDSEGYHLQAYASAKDRNAIIRIITATDTIRFVHEQVHNDFYKVLRFGDAAQKTRDGLAAATLGIETFLLPILELLKPWPAVRLLNYVGLHRIMAFRGTWLPMKSASRIVSIIHQGTADYVESGKVMERFWLQANRAGLSVQALGALPLFLARVHLAQGDGFTSAQLKTLSRLEDDFASITPEFNKQTDQIVMLFRLGYTKQSAPRPYRRALESFML